MANRKILLPVATAGADVDTVAMGESTLIISYRVYSVTGLLTTGKERHMLQAAAGLADADAYEHLGEAVVPNAVDPAERVAVALTDIMGQARRQVGAMPIGVVLVVEASRGPRWRTGLRRAATRAGIATPVLLDRPVAITAGLQAAGAYLPAGSMLAVADVGAHGTEVAIVAVTAGGFDTVAVSHSNAAAGDLIDQVLAEKFLADRLPTGQPVGQPGTPASPALDAVRHAKHALSHTAATTLHVPGTTPVTVSQQQLRDVTRPQWEQCAALIREVATAADTTITELSGVYLCGGAAQVPAAAEHLTTALGVPVIVMAGPAHAAQHGAHAHMAQQPAPAGAARRWQVPWWATASDLFAFGLPLIASLLLFGHTLAVTDIYRTFTGPDVIITIWSGYGLASLAAVLACTSAARAWTGAWLADRRIAPHTPQAARRQADTATTGAAAGAGIAVVYGLIAKTVSGLNALTDAPFISTVLWAALPTALILTAAAQLTRWRPSIAQPPLPSTAAILVACLGTLLLQAGLSGKGFIAENSNGLWPHLAQLGGAILAASFALLLLQRTSHRLIATLILAAAGITTIGLSTVDTIGTFYITLTTFWIAIHTARNIWRSLQPHHHPGSA